MVTIRPHEASEVYVTGTFDDWGKTIRLEKKGDVFEKEVPLSPTEEKLHYKVREALLERVLLPPFLSSSSNGKPVEIVHDASQSDIR